MWYCWTISTRPEKPFLKAAQAKQANDFKRKQKKWKDVKRLQKKLTSTARDSKRFQRAEKVEKDSKVKISYYIFRVWSSVILKFAALLSQSDGPKDLFNFLLT